MNPAATSKSVSASAWGSPGKLLNVRRETSAENTATGPGRMSLGEMSAKACHRMMVATRTSPLARAVLRSHCGSLYVPGFKSKGGT